MNSVINPLLGPLQDNGGLTWSHAAHANSPVIDTGNPSASLDVGNVPLYDQRGFAFSRVVGGRIDMGALEEGAVSADFDEDSDVDGGDFLAWQRGFGIQAPNATISDGDADDDQDVDDDDLIEWQGQFGTGPTSLVTAANPVVAVATLPAIA